MAASTDLVCLIYVSRASPRSEADLDGVLSDILTDAIPRNRDRNVTGLLIAHRGWFIHALEGPAEAVRETFDDVCADERHLAPRKLVETPADRRMFDGWSLGARVLNAADVAVLRGFDAPDRFDAAALPERVVLRLLAVVADAHHDRFTAQQQMMARR